MKTTTEDPVAAATYPAFLELQHFLDAQNVTVVKFAQDFEFFRKFIIKTA